MAKYRTCCYYCGFKSAENAFKYYDNGKRTQPRYQCGNCQKFFTMGSSGRPQGRTYTKQRSVDPPELKGLPRECCCCGVADNSPSEYYNNKNLCQPRFKCLSCGQQFQMRLMGTGEERRLMHTSYQRQPNSDRQKLNVTPNSDDDDISEQMQAAEDPWMPALGPDVDLFPALSVEDAKYLDFIEAGLRDEKKAPPSAAVLRPGLAWASKLPRSWRQSC